MDGIHDLGGMDGFGPIPRESGEPVFHGDWERRVFALSEATGWTVPLSIDAFRQEVERMPPADYLAAPYYARWLFALETLLARAGAVTGAEIEARIAGAPAGPPAAAHPSVCRPENALRQIAEGGRYTRAAADVAQRFRPGDAVVARNVHPPHHTRLPRYARGRHGEIAADHGIFVLPDSNAQGAGERPQHLYAVRFAARELWGPDASEGDRLFLDLFEDYLEPAP